jgi:hypothetical protein
MSAPASRVTKAIAVIIFANREVAVEDLAAQFSVALQTI